jgi:MoxR-like ATPase
VRRALVFDAAFHDVDRLLARLSPGIVPWEQLNQVGAAIQDSVQSSATIERYVLDIWQATETPQSFGIALDGVDMDRLILAGASPRGMSALLRAARVVAWLANRSHLLPEDIHAVLMPALGHRVFFTPIYELRRQEFSEALITQIMNRLAVP